MRNLNPLAGNWFMSIMVFLVGLTLIFNPTMLDTSPNHQLYFLYMTRVASQPIWAGLFLITGALRIWLLFAPSTKNIRWARSGTGVFSSLLWLQIAISVLCNGVLTIGSAVYPMLVVIEIFNAARGALDLQKRVA